MSRIDQLHRLHEADPQDADVLYMLAQEHAKEGGHDEAVEWYDRCIEAKPDYLYAYFHKARSLQAAGDAEAALDAASEGLERANQTSDAKAISELTGLVEELED